MSTDLSNYSTSAAVGLGLISIAIAIVKACEKNGIYIRIPWGDSKYCVFDSNEGRPSDDEALHSPQINNRHVCLPTSTQIEKSVNSLKENKIDPGSMV